TSCLSDWSSDVCSSDLVSRGKLTGSRTEGRHLRFRRLDLIDFLRAFQYPVPEALRASRPRVVALDRDVGALAALKRALAKRFDRSEERRVGKEGGSRWR